MITRLRVSAVEPPAGLWGRKEKKFLNVVEWISIYVFSPKDRRLHTDALQLVVLLFEERFRYASFQLLICSYLFFDYLDLNPKLCLARGVVFPLII